MCEYKTRSAFPRAGWRMAAVLLPLLLLSTVCEASPPQGKAASTLPADVVAFKAKRDQCDHFRGEDPGEDEARAAQLQRKVDQTCKGTDARLKALRRQYADNPKVMAALAHYEDDVE